MSEENYIPDSPFRCGASGKYKLLIRSVTPKYNGYEYDLVDAEEKQYCAISALHYAENQLLRCMVSFDVVKARLVVSETVICKKQDLATLIPEEKRSKPESKSNSESKSSKTTKKPKGKVSNHLGNPKKSRVSGYYLLRVSKVEQDKPFYSYLLEDAKGNLYKAKSDTLYSEGRTVTCKVSVVLSEGGNLKVSVVSVGKAAVAQMTKKRKKFHKKYHQTPSYSHIDWPSPSKGDFFHLIYTPMGNKR